MPDKLFVEVFREIFGQREGDPDDRVGLQGREDTKQFHRSIQEEERKLTFGSESAGGSN